MTLLVLTGGQIESMEEAHLPGLKDWTAIRAHLKRHDDEMIKDYEDDINTMLVFVSSGFLITSHTR